MKMATTMTTPGTMTTPRRTTMPDIRLIPDPTLARAEIDARLRALGHALVLDEPRTHQLQRRTIWQRADDSKVTLCEHHVVGERYAVVSGDGSAPAVEALAPVDRATLLTDGDRVAISAMPALRRLCLLERDEPSPELRAWLERALLAPELLVRTAAMAAALSLARAHALWALELAVQGEPVAALREQYRRTLEVETSGDTPPAS
jgi:hypothetical protein